MKNLSEKDLDMLTHLLKAEGMACKKARIYSHTLTDPALAEEMTAIAADHETRYKKLYEMLSGVEL